MSITSKIKNKLNKLPPHLGNLHMGTILADMSDEISDVAGDVAELGTSVSELVLSVGELEEYNTTPVQIGTWDFRPVYRKSFEVACKDMTVAEYELMRSDKLFTVPGIPNDALFVIEAHCVQTDIISPSFVDSKILNNVPGVGFIQFALDVDDKLPELPEDTEEDPTAAEDALAEIATGFTGYVVYVMPE